MPATVGWEAGSASNAHGSIEGLVHVSDTAFGDLLPSDAPEPEEEVEVSLREEALHRALETLPDRPEESLDKKL